MDEAPRVLFYHIILPQAQSACRIVEKEQKYEHSVALATALGAFFQIGQYLKYLNTLWPLGLFKL